LLFLQKFQITKYKLAKKLIKQANLLNLKIKNHLLVVPISTSNNNPHPLNFITNYRTLNFSLTNLKLLTLLIFRKFKNDDKLYNKNPNLQQKLPNTLKRLIYNAFVTKIGGSCKSFFYKTYFSKKKIFFLKSNTASASKPVGFFLKHSNSVTVKKTSSKNYNNRPAFSSKNKNFNESVFAVLKKQQPIRYNFFKKKVTSKTTALNIYISKFFKKFIPNNYRNFGNFSKLYAQRKFFLKALSSTNSHNFSKNNNLSKDLATKWVKYYPHAVINTSLKNKIFDKFSSRYTLYPLLTVMANPILLKMPINKDKSIYSILNHLYLKVDLILNSFNTSSNHNYPSTNLQPHNKFTFVIFKKIYAFFANNKLHKNIIPIYYHTLIRFIENCSGKKSLIQFYPFVNQHIDKDFIVRYKIWLPRLNFYERRLGHKFFLEEALHIMHLSFFLKDPKLLMSWLGAIIKRISFWKTRSIFRFIKYLMLNFFIQMFPQLSIKGLKITLRGKISAAGNSRKRAILYRAGETSHSKVALRVLSEFGVITTFTGVLGFKVSIFY
jgi:hypothetical protein